MVFESASKVAVITGLLKGGSCKILKKSYGVQILGTGTGVPSSLRSRELGPVGSNPSLFLSLLGEMCY